MTRDDFNVMEMMNSASRRSSPAFGSVGYINETARGVLVRIDGATPQDSASVARVLKAWFPETESLGKTPESHHIIPNQFVKECFDLGILVDDFTVAIDYDWHRGKGGLHSQGYNKVWEPVIDESQNMSKDDGRQTILGFAKQLVEVCGWGGAGIQKHKTHLK